MNILLVIAALLRLLLFGIFAVSGVAKLAARERTTETLINFGISSRIARPLTTFLIVVELLTAVFLLPVFTVGYAAIGATVLLLAFSIAIVVNLARGRTPDCNCFGQLHSEPIGWRTLARNVALFMSAGVVAYTSRDAVNFLVWTASLSSAEQVLLCIAVLALAAMIVQCAILVQVLLQQGRILLRLDTLEQRREPNTLLNPSPRERIGEPIGAPAPSFAVPGIDGNQTPITLNTLLERSLPTLLIFSNPNCGPCNALMPKIAQWQSDYAPLITTAIISEGTLRDNRRKAAEHRLTNVFIQRGREIAEKYHAYATPAAVLVERNGTIGSFVATGSDAIEELVAGALSRRPAPLERGELAPDLTFTAVSGRQVRFLDFRGMDLLVLFWNPGCTFCQKMLSEFRSWEATRDSAPLQVLVISSGTRDENAAQNFSSPVAIDNEYRAGRLFGVSGTPAALHLDAEGRIASFPAIGSEAIFALIRDIVARLQQPLAVIDT